MVKELDLKFGKHYVWKGGVYTFGRRDLILEKQLKKHDNVFTYKKREIDHLSQPIGSVLWVVEYFVRPNNQTYDIEELNHYLYLIQEAFVNPMRDIPHIESEYVNGKIRLGQLFGYDSLGFRCFDENVEIDDKDFLKDHMSAFVKAGYRLTGNLASINIEGFPKGGSADLRTRLVLFPDKKSLETVMDSYRSLPDKDLFVDVEKQ